MYLDLDISYILHVHITKCLFIKLVTISKNNKIVYKYSIK